MIATGLRLAFEEVPGAGLQGGHTQAICTIDHTAQAHTEHQLLLANPGPAIIEAMPGASCFGPAYESAFIFSHDLKKRRLRHKAPTKFVTSEPYIGHLGLGGVGIPPEGMLDSERRGHDIKWIYNACVIPLDRIRRGPGEVSSTDARRS